MADRDDYDSIKRMNASTLVHGLKSMWSLKCAIDGGFTSTPAMQFGSQYHCLILEPGEFTRTHAVMPNFAIHADNIDAKGLPSTSANTSWARETRTLFADECEVNGREIITEQNYEKAQAMIAGIQRNKLATELIETSEKEVTLLGEIDGVEFKGRVDLLRTDALSDIKGTPNASDRPFGGSMAKLNTAFKMSIYRELIRQQKNNAPDHVYLIAVESGGDFDTCVYEIPDIVLDNGFSKVRRTLEQFKIARDTDTWPGLQADEAVQLHVPNWSMDQDELEWL